MARRAQKEANVSGHGTSALRGNGYDKEQVQSFVDRVERVQGDIDDKMKAAKELCEPHRIDIKLIKKEAKGAGIPLKEFNAILSKRRKLAAAEAIRDKLTDEQQDNFDQLESALGMFGDTPLGTAALSRSRESDVIHA